ncbi:hypothetical protein L211DRAFT_853318 [Terfezia boudieri ATCC MYA-4762]|uniref:Uncharacterized protein n=1 Tax=Terfezia boudieri ATCC MYA-4762 TaxID=1051890 RepID=A0A3N4L8W5_9PEZI|nr:hypothetical protein L211DRAFT_853318 [Terfezia boudieri ATCC MYA-4762]
MSQQTAQFSNSRTTERSNSRTTERDATDVPTAAQDNYPLRGAAPSTPSIHAEDLLQISSVPWTHESDISLNTCASPAAPGSNNLPEQEHALPIASQERNEPNEPTLRKFSADVGLFHSNLYESSYKQSAIAWVGGRYSTGLLDKYYAELSEVPWSVDLDLSFETRSSTGVGPTINKSPSIGLAAARPSSSNSDDGSFMLSTNIGNGQLLVPQRDKSTRGESSPSNSSTSELGDNQIWAEVSEFCFLEPISYSYTNAVNISPDSTQRSLELGDESSLTPAEMWQTIYDLPEGARRVNAYTKTVSSFRGPERADFLEKFSEYIVAVNERTNTIATIHKNYLDSLSPTDYAAMRTSLPTLHEKVRYDEITEIHMRSMALENRKRNHRKRIADIWGSDWETSLREILPKDYSEGFLWRLARLANAKQQPPCLDQMSLELKRIIAKRVRTPKLSKSELLQSVDIINLMNIMKESGKLQVLLYPKRLAQDIVSVRNDETAITTIIPDQDMDSTDSSNISPTNLPQTPKVIDDIQPSITQNSMVAVVISEKRKNLLSPPFSRQKKAKLLPPRIKQSESSQLLPQSDLNRRFFVVDLTIESIHPVLVDEKIDQLKKVAEESSDAHVQRNIELASEAVGMIIGGQDKDDHPIAREEILERLQLMWDLLEISPAL